MPPPPAVSHDPPLSFPVAAKLLLTVGSPSPRVLQDNLDASALAVDLRNKSIPCSPNPHPPGHVADRSQGRRAFGTAWKFLSLLLSCPMSSLCLGLVQRGVCRGQDVGGGLLLCSSPPPLFSQTHVSGSFQPPWLCCLSFHAQQSHGSSSWLC